MGEVVFNTGMVGYTEALTDPSYHGQLLALTYPLVGNYGVPARVGAHRLALGFESSRIHAAALIVATLSRSYSHWNAVSSLDAWLKEAGVVGLEGIDTRALTKQLRVGGTMSAKILVDGDAEAIALAAQPFGDAAARNLVAEVSDAEPRLLGDGSRRVILVDCGAKHNVVRSLLQRGISVLRVPWDHDFNREEGDGILVSNGPGDPKMAERTVEHLRVALNGERPIFGICLGHQLVARAAGCDTYKLPYGHRSQNQPCIELGTERCYVTSQNHGYAVDVSTLSDEWEEWFVNANDRTNEGIRHRERPFMTVQFHPEAMPGPDDTAFLFDRFVKLLP
jgi:carbamoyl-phosphate synthase small subunit